jgi:hypothetical protein
MLGQQQLATEMFEILVLIFFFFFVHFQRGRFRLSNSRNNATILEYQTEGTSNDFSSGGFKNSETDCVVVSSTIYIYKLTTRAELYTSITVVTMH